MHAFRRYQRHHGPQLAAAIAFHVLLSLFPLAILLVAVSAVAVDRSDIDRLIGTALASAPLTPAARSTLAHELHAVIASRPQLGLVGAAALAWSASAVMAALRTAVNVAYGVSEGRSFIRGKLVDLLLLTCTAALALVSVALTLAARAGGALGEDVTRHLGPLADESMAASALAAGVLAPTLVAFLATLVIYVAVPAERPPIRRALIPATLVAVAVVALANGFAIYLDRVGSYDAVYGSLGGLAAFLVLVYLTANILVLGAELVGSTDAPGHRSDDDGHRLTRARRASRPAAHRARVRRPRARV